MMVNHRLSAPPFDRRLRNSLLTAFTLLATQTSFAQKPIAVPLEILRTGHAAVKATINGKGPFRLALDTGSPVTFVSNFCASKAGILTKEEADSHALFQLPRTVDTIEVGGAKLKDLSVMVIDHPTIQMIGQVEGQIDGIVGFSFFSHYRMTLDYAARKVILEPTDYQPEDIFASLMNRFMSDQPARKIIAPAGLWGIRFGERQGDTGIAVKAVYPGSAAEKAGLKAGDVVTSIDGRWTTSVLDAAEAAKWVKPGQAAVVKFLRDGQQKEAAVVPRAGM